MADADETEKKLNAIKSDSAKVTPDAADSFTLREEMENRASRAAYRAEVANQELKDALGVRIGILQAKLDLREAEVLRLGPEVAELRQARRSARLIDT